MMHVPDKRGHRAIGSGARTITVQRRNDLTPNGDPNPGYTIFIGRALWQDLGSPDRVSIHLDTPGYYSIDVAKNDAGYKVTGASVDGMPRIRVGRGAMEALRLPEGVYAASAGTVKIEFRI